MKTSLKFRSLISFFLVMILLLLNISASTSTGTAAGKPPTATPGGPTPTPGGNPTATPAASNTLNVSGTPWGVSTCNIGGVEASADFNVADLTDMGMNTYRLYGGMSRWEAQDDDGVYGSPSIATIKANLNSINWAWWDNVMTNPPSGTDYWWSGGTPIWTGNARTLFQALKDNGIRPVVTLRNVDNAGNPAWAAALNPPNTPEDWNEWWEHVFATVYWFNVRNDYRVDDWQVHNEPNHATQGWGGSEADYWEFVRQTNDAIQYVYTTYLPGRTPHVYAPVAAGQWPLHVLQQAPSSFDIEDTHNYDADMRTYDTQVHGWMTSTGYPTRPLWITEWGSWHQDKYDTLTFIVNVLITNLIYGSQPGDVHMDGNHIFSVYDWGTFKSGLVGPNQTKRAGYYGMRLAIRGLQGCKTTYQTTSSNTNLVAITTKDALGKIYLLVANNAPSASYTVDANLSALITSGAGTMWQFSSGNMDVVVGSPALNNGHVTFTLPGTAAILIKF
jgi:hypothetical protein